jgi:hypothetical protein
METPSPWATKADIEALKADIAALDVNLATMHADLRTVKVLLTELRDRRPWWRRLFAAGTVITVVAAVSTEALADRLDGNRLYELCRPNSRSNASCDDFVLSVADALMVGRLGGWTACIPNSVPDNQMIAVTTRFLEALLRGEAPLHWDWSPKPSQRPSRANKAAALS